MIRLNTVPDSVILPGIREMEDRDLSQVAHLFTRYIQRFGMHPIFDLEEIKHQFLSGRGTGNVGDGGPGRRKGQVTWAYVVEVICILRNVLLHTNHRTCRRILIHIG